MTHPLSDTCAACRAAKQLGLTEPAKITLLHQAAQHLIDFYLLDQRGEELGFDVLADSVTEMLEEHVIRSETPTTHH